MERLAAVSRHVLGGSDPTPTPSPAGAAGLTLKPRQLSPHDIIFGCAPLRADLPPPRVPLPLAETDAAVHAALEAGIVCFDTAPLYGDSEDRLGHGLRASPLGSSAQVITKAGKLLRHKDRLDTPVDWSPFAIPAEERERLPDFTAAGARRSFDESCARIGVKRFDALRLHDPDSVEGAAAAALGPDGIIVGLRQLRDAGVIGEISLGMNANLGHKVVEPGKGEGPGTETKQWDPSMVLEMIEGAPPGTFDHVLLAYAFNLYSQDGASIMAACEAKGIGVHLAGVFGGGGMLKPAAGVNAVSFIYIEFHSPMPS